MKNLVQMFSIATLSGLALMGCGESKSHKAPPVVAKEPARVKTLPGSLGLTSTHSDDLIIGKWTTPCELNKEAGNGVQIDLEITDSYLMQTLKIFSDAACKAPLFDLITVGSYSATDKDVSVIAKRHSAIVHDIKLAHASSQAVSCGFGIWAAEVEYDVTDKSCPKKSSGITITGNKKDAKSTFGINIRTVQDGTKLALDADAHFTRAAPEGIQDKDPPAVISIFSSKNYVDNEQLLKTYGCETSNTFGIRNCPTPKDLAEASLLYDRLGEFLVGLWNDPLFKDRKEETKDLVASGYSEQAKVNSFPAYVPHYDLMLQDVKEFNEKHTDRHLFSGAPTVNAVDFHKGYLVLVEVAKQPDFENQMQRLGIKYFTMSNYFGMSSSVREGGKEDEKEYGIAWSFKDTAESAWTKILAMKPNN